MTVQLRVVERTRLCVSPNCERAGEQLPWSEFYPAATWEDGTMRRPRSLCRECDRRRARQRQARRRAENPERERRRVRKSKSKYEYKRDREGRRHLPVGPWREWLLARIDDIERRGAEHPRAVLAHQLGTSDRRVYAWLHECDTHVWLDPVDRALCHFGEPMALRDLYPELYETQEAA